MAQEPVNYEAVLADLEAKRASLDAAIAALKQAVHSNGPSSDAAPQLGGKPLDPALISDDAFFGLSIVEAAKKYLMLVKRKQTVKEIADALDRGGLPHTSSNFVGTVGTMLRRANDAELVKIGRGDWGLAGWYGNRRPKQEPVKKVKRSRAGSGSHQRTVAKHAPSSEGAGSTGSGPSVRELAEASLRAAGKPLHLNEMMDSIRRASGRTIKKDTLAALFSVTVRKKDTFFKAAPGVFGLIEQAGSEHRTH